MANKADPLTTGAILERFFNKVASRRSAISIKGIKLFKNAEETTEHQFGEHVTNELL